MKALLFHKSTSELKNWASPRSGKGGKIYKGTSLWNGLAEVIQKLSTPYKCKDAVKLKILHFQLFDLFNSINPTFISKTH